MLALRQQRMMPVQMLSAVPQRYFSTENAGEQQEQGADKIDFGFQQVNKDEKQGKVGEVFSSVADSYDVMNDAMSVGVHRLWKNTFVEAIGPLKRRKVLNSDYEIVDEVPLKILDVAGGTGDISFKILEKARRDDPVPGSKSNQNQTLKAKSDHKCSFCDYRALC